MPPVNEEEEQDFGIACLALPIQAAQLLVPSVSIAEMALVAPIFPDNSGPDWFLGHYSWRTHRVPLISFEKLTREQGGGINPNGRIAVFNNTGVSSDLPFIAIPTQGIPRVMNIRQDNIFTTDTEAPGAYELMNVQIEEEEMIVPDISALEQAYCEFKDRLV